MSETPTRCDRFIRSLHEEGRGPVPPDHLESCSDCRGQLEAHRMLAAAFADESLPGLSPGFDSGLDRKLEAAVEVRPLRGWRTVAMLAYTLVAGGIVAWLLRDAPLPAVAPLATWVALASFLAIPLSFALAIAASRWMPAPEGPRGPLTLAI